MPGKRTRRSRKKELRQILQQNRNPNSGYQQRKPGRKAQRRISQFFNYNGKQGAAGHCCQRRSHRRQKARSKGKQRHISAHHNDVAVGEV
jgi:hypothetical protein